MGMLEELFGEYVDLGDGNHADVLMDQEPQQPLEHGEKRFTRTYPKPNYQTAKKPDSLGRERCHVLGKPIPCANMDGRGMGKDLEGELNACPDCGNEILLRREDGSTRCHICSKDFPPPEPMTKYEEIHGRNVSINAYPPQVKALAEQFARQQETTNQLAEQLNSLLQLLRDTDER